MLMVTNENSPFTINLARGALLRPVPAVEGSMPVSALTIQLIGLRRAYASGMISWGTMAGLESELINLYLGVV